MRSRSVILAPRPHDHVQHPVIELQQLGPLDAGEILADVAVGERGLDVILGHGAEIVNRDCATGHALPPFLLRSTWSPMGKRTPIRPDWTANLATLIASGEKVRAMCDRCPAYRDLDLPALAAAKGADFSLWGKVSHCRLTEGCPGRNRFYFSGRGKFSPMRD